MLGDSMGHFFGHESVAGGGGVVDGKLTQRIHQMFSMRVRMSAEELIQNESVVAQFAEHPAQSMAAFALMIITMLVREGSIRIVEEE